MPRYRVTITEVAETTVTRSEWRQVADSGNPMDGGAQYRHVPLETTQTTTLDVYQQQVPTLDINAVIRAVNGMGA
jgi:hypothetical protein